MLEPIGKEGYLSALLISHLLSQLKEGVIGRINAFLMLYDLIEKLQIFFRDKYHLEIEEYEAARAAAWLFAYFEELAKAKLEGYKSEKYRK